MSNTLAKQNIQSLHGLIKQQEKGIQSIAASHVNPKRLAKLVLACVSKTPALAQCTPTSVMRALMQCAELGLEPGSATGEAYLVPYKTECQLIPGYRGLISLAFRSGQIKSISAVTVHQGDTFEYERGLEPKLRHVPSMEVDKSNSNMTHAYCVIQLMSGGVVYDVMTTKEINAIRGRSKASNSGPWVSDYLEMAKKTVVRRTIKYAPMSVEMARTLAIDDHVTGLVQSDGIDAYDVEFDDLDPETGEIIEKPESGGKAAEIAGKIGAGDPPKDGLGI